MYMIIKRKKFILILFLLNFISFHCFSTKNEYEIIYNKIYNFEFKDADSILNNISYKNDNKTIFYLTKAYINWWYMLISENNNIYKTKYKLFLDSSKATIDNIKINNSSYENIFYAINIYAFISRLKIIEKQYFSIIVNLKECIDFIEFSLGKENLYPSFYLTSGLYNYTIDFAAKKYPFWFSWNFFYPKGNMSLGINQLKIAQNNNSNLINTEATYFLYKIYNDLEENYVLADKYIKILNEKYSNNFFFYYLSFQIKLKQYKFKEAVDILDKIRKLSSENNNLNSEQKKYIFLKAKEELVKAKK